MQTSNRQAGAIVHTRRADVVEVMLSGEFDLATAETLADTFETVLPACSQLIVDTSKVSFLDSSTIRELVNTAKEAKATGVPFTLVVVEDSVVETALELTGVLETLNRGHSPEKGSREPIPRQ